LKTRGLLHRRIRATTVTRDDFVTRYADTAALIIGTHFAAPTAGHSVRDGKSWRLSGGCTNLRSIRTHAAAASAAGGTSQSVTDNEPCHPASRAGKALGFLRT
jgi:hypothetical protein